MARCFNGLIFTMVLIISTGSVQAGLWDPPVINESFEMPDQEPGQWSQRIDDWFESSYWGSFCIHEGSGVLEVPETPYGNQWAGYVPSTTSNELYQQIGTWDEGIYYRFSLIFGKLENEDFGGVKMTLWAGGNPGLASDDVSIGVIGATEIDSEMMNPFDGWPTSQGGVSEDTMTFNTGSGMVTGDPLWIEFSGNTTSHAFFDNVQIEFVTFLTLPGDLDKDGDVDVRDLSIMVNQWPNIDCASHPDDCADLVGDDGINMADYAVLAGDWLGEYTLSVGSLKVNLSPQEVIDDGAQWRVDNGTWHNSGDIVEGLSVGVHTLEYTTHYGWDSPTAQSVWINPDRRSTIDGAYIRQLGSLQVTISPQDAAEDGAQWRVDGGTWHNSGVTESGLGVGQHTLEFKDVFSWITAGNQIVDIFKDQTTITGGEYTHITGSLEVNIFPSGAITGGAQWRVDDGAWHDSGETQAEVGIGPRLLEFSDITGWNEPGYKMVDISEGQTSTTYGTYVLKMGSLQVIIEPANAITAGAQWRVDSGPWRNSHYIEHNLLEGSHTVEFKTITDWITPDSQIVQVYDVQTTTSTGTYIPHTGSLQVTITPQGAIDDGAQWRVIGGDWHNSGETDTEVLVGQRTLEFKDVFGWAEPGNQLIQVVQGQFYTSSGTYTQSVGSLQVTIEPSDARSAGAQWRVDGGVWRDSGYTQTGLSVDSHLVEFKDTTGWVTPETQTLQINDSQTTTYTGTYTVPASINVVINEIHYNPDLKTEFAEFIELYNAGTSSVDISDWYFTDGFSYAFPPGTILGTGGYIVVAQDPITIQIKYGVSSTLIYGPFEGKISNEGETIRLVDDTGTEADEVDYQLGFPWPTVGDAPDEVDGHGHSMQLMNPNLDNDLSGSWRSAYPTPAANNIDVYASNIPPHIRQVNHNPEQPGSGEVVTITAKVTDSDGVASVTLHYQIVNPGSYIPRRFPEGDPPDYTPNPAYENVANWTDLTMHDDGILGDAYAGDDIYTIEMPTSLQTHRRLIRYRITVEDNSVLSIRVPYDDDPQPNFAYFVYDGVPAWTGDGVTYDTDVLTSLPVYHLISRNTDVVHCQWYSSYDNNDYRFYGTFVYDGKVYDHVRYRVRGQYSTFMWGKSKWKYNFNRGHYFQAEDDYGEKYKEKWNKMNVGMGACPWWKYPHPDGPWDQGTGGMMLNEPLSFRFYNLAGVPASKSSYFHLRVIDDSVETSPTNQYEGDFWGLYFGFEHADGAFINEHEIPDGNIYKMDASPYDQGQTNQGPIDVTDGSDVINFVNTYRSHPVWTWWQDNVNLDWYYSFKAVGLAVHNSDPRPEQNCLYYHNPDTGQWSIHPWDLDLAYEIGYHWDDPTKNGGYMEYLQYVIDDYTQAQIDYRNRVRELLDLLFNTDQGWQLVNEMSAIISTSYSDKKFIDAERAMWDNHPRVISTGHGNLWYEHNEFLSSKSWNGLVNYYKHFLSSWCYGYNFGVAKLHSDVADSAIPDTPSIIYTGSAGFPENDLTFQCNSFNDPQGAGTFAATKWRIAEIENVNDPNYNLRQRHKYEIETVWESEEITNSGILTITIPGSEVEEGHYYRVRCRMKDNTGRWSHWSNYIQFIPGEPISDPLLDDLRITEVMYNNGEYEYIELKNTGGSALDLKYVSFTEGISFNFSNPDLLHADFDSNADGFTYSDDTFSTSNPSYAVGTYESSGGDSGGGLRVYLGPGPTSGAVSGGWNLDFVLYDDDVTDIRIKYRMIMGEGYEDDKYAEAILDIDGTRYGSEENNSLVHLVGGQVAGAILITELNPDSPDYVEIQNVFANVVDTSGWVVAANDASVGINEVHTDMWFLDNSMSGGEIQYRTDSSDDNYWGSNIWWTSTEGWAMIVDDAGNVVDFLVWGYDASEIASMNVNINGFDVSGSTVWNGDAINSVGIMARIGNSDNNSASDFENQEDSRGDQNPGLNVPFVGGAGSDTGWQSASFSTPLLTAGTHTITVGAYNNNAVTSDEWVEVFFDEIVITPSMAPPYILNPGEFILVVENLAAFESRYGTGVNVAGQYSGGLSNGGENVKLDDYLLGTIVEFEYNDARGWPTAADGAGHSLVPLDSAIDDEPDGSLKWGGNWRRSSYFNGSPGADDPAVPAPTVVLNEFMAHTDYSNPSYPEYDSNDWIELYNTTGSTVNLTSDWYLSDDADVLKKWAIPSTAVSGNGFVSFDEVTGFHSPITIGFGLNKAGEQIFLSYLPGTSADQVVDCIKFKGQENNVSLGRYPDGDDFWFAMTGSQDTNNNAPDSHAVINEVMYHPPASSNEEEYVEIFNPTGAAVDIWTSEGPWALDGAVDYQFPENITLAVDKKIVVVGFDPIVDTDRLNDFENDYGIGLIPNVDIFGPWTGDLSNATERLTLEKPQASDDPANPQDISWIIVDEVIYSDYTPWPMSPDGDGDALQRISTASDVSGNDSTNWQGASPSPGE